MEKIAAAIEQYAGTATAIARTIGENPELGTQERKASALLARELETQGFALRRGVLDMPTAFIAEYDTGKSGPVIGFLCEYDALPDLGHACGHHLIAAMSLTAAVGLKSAMDELGGKIRVYGTPAEETSGAKVPMAAEGLFDDCSFALMAHPYFRFESSGSSLAMDAVQFEYFGKAAHAAANPEDGVNALDALIQLFNSVNALRQQTRPDARIHGIVVEGGTAANIIPEYAAGQFYVRSAERAYTDKLVERVMQCAEGAALQTGCEWKASNYEFSYDELRTNAVLSRIFNETLVSLGISAEQIHPGQDHGSLDLGNVSLRCPVIHPFVQVTDQPFQLHTPEFRDAAMCDRAFAGMLLGAKALALTAYRAARNPRALADIREEFRA